MSTYTTSAGCPTPWAWWQRHNNACVNSKDRTPMNTHVLLTPLISLIAGILILVIPRLLNFIVAIYLIVVGLLGIFGSGALRI
jgi:hypothetical protein